MEARTMRGMSEVEMENALEDAAKAAFVKAQSVYRSDHDHFPLKSTWETTSESVREGWRAIAYVALEAAVTPPLGTQPEPRQRRDILTALDSIHPERIAELKAAEKALSKLRAECSGQRPVKALDWVEVDWLGIGTEGRWSAQTVVGRYGVIQIVCGNQAGKFAATFDGYELSTPHEDGEAAKAAAQSDFERRIRSALIEPSAF